MASKPAGRSLWYNPADRPPARGWETPGQASRASADLAGHPTSAGQTRPPVIVDADGERSDPGFTSLVLHHAGFVVDTGAEHALRTLQKIVAILLQMKSEQIVAQQAFQQFLRQGQTR